MMLEIKPIAVLLVFVGALVLSHAAARATQFEVYGGPGGQPFTALCPAGYHLVGLEGRTDKWVDKMAPICGSWIKEREGFVNRISMKWVGASEGGTPAAVQCPHGYGLKQWTFWFTVGETLRPKFVSTIHIVCEAVVVDRGHFEFDFGNTQFGYKWAGGGTSPSRPRPSGSNTCPRGELAVGFEGRSGLFIDALALICGPSPTKLNYESSPTQSGNMTTLQRPGKPQGSVGTADATIQAKLVQNYPTILLPTNGQVVVQGELYLQIREPQVGTTPVTEMELTWLDAPPNQPYVNTFVDDTKNLRNRYKPPVGVTGGRFGRWQVRARMSGQAVPGPWSPPTPFLLVATQPTQSQSLPSSKPPIMQTPKQALSGGTTLIRPRGVEKKSGNEGNQTVDQPTEKTTTP